MTTKRTKTKKAKARKVEHVWHRRLIDRWDGHRDTLVKVPDTPFQRFLDEHWACDRGRIWAGRRSLQACWDDPTAKADDMRWLLRELGVTEVRPLIGRGTVVFRAQAPQGEPVLTETPRTVTWRGYARASAAQLRRWVPRPILPRR